MLAQSGNNNDNSSTSLSHHQTESSSSQSQSQQQASPSPIRFFTPCSGSRLHTNSTRILGNRFKKVPRTGSREPIRGSMGFGDRGLNLRLSSPLYLHNVLEDKRFTKCRIVLLHTSYPFSKEASYLASVYSQVYLDFGLAIPKLSVHGMISAVKDLLEQAPLNKVMFSTDAYAFPELFYLGAKNARKVVFSVLRDACIDGDLSVSEAVEAAKDLFARNAINFYKIAS